MKEGIRGWKCEDWIQRDLTDTKWFCKTICPFGRNGKDTKFISCDKDRRKLLQNLELR